ncbi:Rz1-like lysis system protein LysC [Klebsiella aerogenes]
MRSVLSTSGRRLKAISVLTNLFLLPLLTACGNRRTVYLPAPVVPISADLTADTPIHGMEVPFTWQASLELNVKLYSALGQCNLDKAGIRKIEEGRRSVSQ